MRPAISKSEPLGLDEISCREVGRFDEFHGLGCDVSRDRGIWAVFGFGKPGLAVNLVLTATLIVILLRGRRRPGYPRRRCRRANSPKLKPSPCTGGGFSLSDRIVGLADSMAQGSAKTIPTFCGEISTGNLSGIRLDRMPIRPDVGTTHAAGRTAKPVLKDGQPHVVRPLVGAMEDHRFGTNMIFSDRRILASSRASRHAS